MDIAMVVALVAINAFVFISCIVVVKNIRSNRYLDKAKNSEVNGNKPQALKYLDKALKIAPQDIDVISTKDELLRDMGNYNEALEYYNKALVLANSEEVIATINYHLGVLYCNMGNYNMAKSCYDNAKSDNNMADTNFWNNFGILNYRLNNSDEALNCFDKALEINPKAKFVKENKTNLLAELGRL